MRLLLDSHILLWWFAGSRRLGDRARKLIMAPEAELFASAASWWELAIKKSLNRLDLDWVAARAILQKNRIKPIPVTFDHADRAAELPDHHHDPFDRMLVAQAAVEGMKLLTRDPKLRLYGDSVLYV